MSTITAIVSTSANRWTFRKLTDGLCQGCVQPRHAENIMRDNHLGPLKHNNQLKMYDDKGKGLKLLCLFLLYSLHHL